MDALSVRMNCDLLSSMPNDKKSLFPKRSKMIRTRYFPSGLSEKINCILASSATQDMGACISYNGRVLIIGKRMSCQSEFNQEMAVNLADLGIDHRFIFRRFFTNKNQGDKPDR